MKMSKGVSKVAGKMQKYASKNTVTFLLSVAVVALILYSIYLMLNMRCGGKEGFQEGSTYYLIYIYSASCPHCKTFAPIFDSVVEEASKKKPHVKSVKYEANDEGAKQYLDMVHGFPTVLLFKDDTYVTNFVGSQPQEKFMEFVNANVPETAA